MAVLLLAACDVHATVAIDVHEDGSGVVRLGIVLDPAAVVAAEAGGGRLEERVRLADLEPTGWLVSAWTRRPDGSAAIRLRRPFDRPEELAAIVAELNGPAGPLHDVTVTRRRSFVSWRTTVRGRADLPAASTGVTQDAEVLAALAAQGVDVAALDQQLDAGLHRAVHLRVVVRVPGRGPTRIEADQPTQWEVSGRVVDVERIAWLSGGAALVLAGLVLWATGARRRARTRRAQGGAR